MRPRSEARLRLVLGLTAVVLVMLVGFTGYQALQAREALERVAIDLQRLSVQLTAGEQQDARDTLMTTQAAAADAAANTQGPGWWLTSRLPGVGDDIEAVRTVAEVSDELASGVLPDLVEASDALEPEDLRPSDGRVDLEPIRAVADRLVADDAELQRLSARVLVIDTSELNPQLAQPVRLVQNKLREAAALSAKASYAVRLLPRMLGAEGERSYVVMLQDNAEVRATGGVPRVFTLLTADRGEISLGQQVSASSLGVSPGPVLPLTPDERAVFPEPLGTRVGSYTLTPEFPRTARIVQARWKLRTGTTLDGVVSVDAVALSSLLSGTGPVEVPGTEPLTAATAADELLSTLYRRQPDPVRQDQVLADALRAVADAALSGAGDAHAVLDGLAGAAGERRLLVWSAEPEEQQLLDETLIAGRVPDDGERPEPFVGVFLNDRTGAKMQYHLDHRVDVTPVDCDTDGVQTLEVTATVESTAPADTELPEAVRGREPAGPGSMRVDVSLYAPTGGRVVSVEVDGDEVQVAAFEHLGHPVARLTTELSPGEKHVVVFTVLTGPGQRAAVELRTTPGARTAGVGSVDPSTCG